jgi:hypothetical protein
MDIEFVEILYNSCYGGYGYSDEFCNYYNNLTNSCIAKFDMSSIEDRMDPNIIYTFKQLGSSKSSSNSANLKVTVVPKGLLNYVKMSEYDGREKISIDYDRAYRDLLETIMKEDNISNETKERYNYLKYVEKNVYSKRNY